jgi:hypothetical protein
MIKNFKDTVVLLITAGVLILLAVIIVMKMSVTGLIGVIGGYIGGKN